MQVFQHGFQCGSTNCYMSLIMSTKCVSNGLFRSAGASRSRTGAGGDPFLAFVSSLLGIYSRFLWLDLDMVLVSIRVR
jgi:hypothetical protein